MTDTELTLARIADALERIAAALELEALEALGLVDAVPVRDWRDTPASEAVRGPWPIP